VPKALARFRVLSEYGNLGHMITDVSIRPAEDRDRDFILSLSQRFAQVPLPEWRSYSEVAEGTRRWLERALVGGEAGTLVLVAEAPEGDRVGFIYLHEQEDFFTGERHPHVSEIAVVPEVVGRGVGALLMRAAEHWSRQHGYSRMTLNVFHANRRARTLYEHLGYAPESVKYVKPLARTSPDADAPTG
jgi:GNAT superfamily N-acetyltransferase